MYGSTYSLTYLVLILLQFLWGPFENMMEKMKEVDSLVEPDTDDCLRLYDYIDDALRALKEVCIHVYTLYID